MHVKWLRSPACNFVCVAMVRLCIQWKLSRVRIVNYSVQPRPKYSLPWIIYMREYLLDLMHPQTFITSSWRLEGLWRYSTVLHIFQTMRDSVAVWVVMCDKRLLSATHRCMFTHHEFVIIRVQLNKMKPAQLKHFCTVDQQLLTFDLL